MNVFRTLLHYLWPKDRLDLRVRAVLAIVCLIASKVVNLYVPFFFKSIIDALSQPSALIVTVPALLIVGYGLARVFQQALSELRDLIFVKVSQHAQRSIALETFKHIHGLSLAFHLDRQTGGLSRVIDRGTHGMQFVLTFMTFNIVPTIIEILLVTLVLYAKYNAIFSGIIFGTIVGYIIYTLWITNWRTRYRRTMNQKDIEANTKAVDSLINYETVKYFNNEEAEFHRFDESLQGYEAASVKSQNSLSVLNIGQGVIIGFGLVLVMFIAAKGVAQKQLTVGDIVLLNTFLLQLYFPLNFLGFAYREIRQGLIDMGKMFELLDVKKEVRDIENAQALSVSDGHLEFRDVSFAYSNGRKVLDHVSFDVKPGETVAIVGPSGAGKSTISRLLYRFYEIQDGEIRVDSQNIRNVTQKSLRGSVGIVPQDTVLFNDTIEYNIRYGKITASHTEIVEAAKQAKIHDFIMGLPEQYETRVGERGLKLSGGEKQRVAIARTILKNAPILVFDEATSALDSKTEKDIQQSMRLVSKNKTTLVIAHRLSTIVDADEILVLKDGHIFERGLHEDLLTKGGEYASMWRKQQKAAHKTMAA
ncbi:MAG: ABC transporter ATP-binding protein/permease [Bdellovibrionales bacterium]|nr:ABC transporter ATP-binding protein/permease [Bdellovibrionales bacterium]